MQREGREQEKKNKKNWKFKEKHAKFNWYEIWQIEFSRFIMMSLITRFPGKCFHTLISASISVPVDYTVNEQMQKRKLNLSLTFALNANFIQ